MRIALAALAGSCALLASPALAGITITPIAIQGDSAGNVGRITRIDNVAVNESGSWLVEADTDHANADLDQVLLHDGAVELREGDALPSPAGSTLDSFDSVNLDQAGHSSWNFFLAGTGGINNDSGIFYDTTLLIQESNISTAPGFSPGTPYIGFFDARPNDVQHTLLVASIDDPAIPTTVDRALVILDNTGGTLVSETVLAKEGDVLPGQTESVADFGTGPHQTDFNDAGQVLFFADLNGDTARDGVIYLDATLLAQEGSASPVAGRNYELLSSRGLALNASGQYVFKANLDGDTADDEMIVKDGAVLVREGGTLPAIGGFLFTGFGLGSGPVDVDDLGHVLWFGDWDDPDLNKDTALFLDDQIVAAENHDFGGGMVLDEIASGEDAFALSDDGRWVIFEGTLLGGLNAVFLVDLAPETAVPGELSAAATPPRTRLLPNFPNPFNPATQLRFELAQPGAVRLAILDAAGRAVRRFDLGLRGAGAHAVAWDGRDDRGRELASGVYFVQLRSGLQASARRVTLLR